MHPTWVQIAGIFLAAGVLLVAIFRALALNWLRSQESRFEAITRSIETLRTEGASEFKAVRGEFDRDNKAIWEEIALIRTSWHDHSDKINQVLGTLSIKVEMLSGLEPLIRGLDKRVAILNDRMYRRSDDPVMDSVPGESGREA